MRQAPPGLRSSSQDKVRKPCGPHQWMRCRGSVHSLKTRSRGASKRRVMLSSRASASALRAIVTSLRLHRLQIGIETIEALLPEPAIMFEPFGRFLQWSGLKPTRPPLLFAALGDHARLLEHLE